MSDDQMVSNPPHYTRAGIEVIDVIESFDLNYRKGNAAKYILRAGYKGVGIDDEIRDLEKAIWYLKREVKALESRQHSARVVNVEYSSATVQTQDGQWQYVTPNGTLTPIPESKL